MDIDEAIGYEVALHATSAHRDKKLKAREEEIIASLKREFNEFKDRDKKYLSELRAVYNEYILARIAKIETRDYPKDNLFEALDGRLAYHEGRWSHEDTTYHLHEFCCGKGGTLLEYFPAIRRQMNVLENIPEKTPLIINKVIPNPWQGGWMIEPKEVKFLYAGTAKGEIRWKHKWLYFGEEMSSKAICENKNNDECHLKLLDEFMYGKPRRADIGSINNQPKEERCDYAKNLFEIVLDGEIIFPNKEYIEETNRIYNRWQAFRKAGHRINDVVHYPVRRHTTKRDLDYRDDGDSGYMGGTWGCS